MFSGTAIYENSVSITVYRNGIQCKQGLVLKRKTSTTNLEWIWSKHCILDCPLFNVFTPKVAEEIIEKGKRSLVELNQPPREKNTNSSKKSTEDYKNIRK
ncbi:1996_t:CDS:2 [Diversispora eburnea]|uniref:1996_t:CDS:1 n=1 Tax=Diversispora eburnea TaxID=1213867 RepID=A0A9N9FF55_9GLOM|nr:1996_t:CDS:2 [Diversispora eburnea]